MSSESASSDPPVIPPMWFAERFSQQGDRLRSPFDPLVMLAWHLVTERDREPRPLPLPEV